MKDFLSKYAFIFVIIGIVSFFGLVGSWILSGVNEEIDKQNSYRNVNTSFYNSLHIGDTLVFKKDVYVIRISLHKTWKKYNLVEVNKFIYVDNNNVILKITSELSNGGESD